MLYGYARCSTDDTKQDIDRQIKELKQQGIKEENIFFEYQSGMKADRIQLWEVLNKLAQGDTLIATEVSRVTRSTKQLCEIIELAKAKKLCFIFGTFKVDCSKELDPMTEGMLKMMGVFSELERNMISQRVKSGMANARSKGKLIGRKPTGIDDIPQVFFKHYSKYQAGSINKKEYARLCNLSYPTIYKYLDIIQRQ